MVTSKLCSWFIKVWRAACRTCVAGPDSTLSIGL